MQHYIGKLQVASEVIMPIAECSRACDIDTNWEGFQKRIVVHTSPYASHGGAMHDSWVIYTLPAVR